MKHFRLRRVFAAFMAAAMVMGLAACGSDNNVEDDVQDSEIVASGTELTQAQYLDLLNDMNEYVDQARRDSLNPGDSQPGDMPEGELPEGEAPADMPEGGAPNGEAGGEAPDGEVPENMPEGEMPDGEGPQGADNSEMVTFFTNMLSITAPEGYEDVQVLTQAVSNAMLEYLDASDEETKNAALDAAALAQIEVQQALNTINAAAE